MRETILLRLKKRIFNILEVTSKDDWLSWVDDIFITSLIILNALAVILETVESFYSQYKNIFDGFEHFSIAAFTSEYLLQIVDLYLK